MMSMSKPTSKAAKLQATRSAREQVAEQIVEETAPPKAAGVQRMTLVLTNGVASRVEEAIFALRNRRRVSFGAFTEAALEDFLAKNTDEQFEILDRFEARARRRFPKNE
jgi:hypothetical protein